MYSKLGGFTLVELLVVIAVIPFLITLALPAVQQDRELSNRELALATGSQFAENVAEYVDTTGRDPETLSDVLDFCIDNPDCLQLGLQDAEDSGYTFYLDGDNQILEAWPARPGLTGNQTVYIDLSDGSNWLEPTPGADRNRRNALASLLARSGEVVGNLLVNEPGAAAQIDAQGDLLSPAEVLLALDVNGDQFLDGVEISGQGNMPRLGGPDAGRVIRSFLQVIGAELALGSGDEDLMSFGVRNVSGDNTYASYDTIIKLLASYVEPGAPTRRLIGILRRADARQSGAELQRAYQLLDNFQRHLDAGVGLWITRDHAEQLKKLLTMSTGWEPVSPG